MKRKVLSKKTRFEVFKRDQFKCQYCGNKAPDFVLHVDHLKPVSKGGTNELINLVTACESCNQGKGARMLSDGSLINVARQQLEDMSIRHEQALMLLAWHEEMGKSKSRIIEKISDYVNTKINPYTVTKTYKHKIGTWIEKYGFNKVIKAIDISCETYLKHGVDEESAALFAEKIPGILYLREKGKVAQQISKLKYVGKSKFNHWDDKRATIIINNLVSRMKTCDFSEGQIIDELEHLKQVTNKCRHWSQWRCHLESLL